MTKGKMKYALSQLDMDEPIYKLSHIHSVLEGMERIRFEMDEACEAEDYINSWASIVKEYIEGLEKTANKNFQWVNFLSKTIDEEL